MANKITVKKIKDIKSLNDLHENRILDGQQEPWNKAVIVFTQDNFTKEYTEEERSYLVGFEYNKFFRTGVLGSGLFGACLDGTDECLRLNNSYYPYWKVESVYTCEVVEDGQ